MNIKYFSLVLFYVLLDQITKFLIVNNIAYNSFIKINDYINIVNVSNTGVAFSMFQGQNIFFIILTTVVIITIVSFIKKNKSEFTILQLHSLLLIISGGIGNLIDRLFRGAVVDFIDIGFKDVYRWPSFNVADSCVCIGVTLFLFSMLFLNKCSKCKIM
ncbi:MAG: signal peptidase II [Endomicrobiia bacterium]|nr:signal peptidase II [Endomicrobiaceae bacterium]MDD3054037.1 signal peptidase II [Endomicrobiaceae bacterium]